MSHLFESERYLFVFAHPDDELYCAVLINRLLAHNKEVATIHITSGDAGQGNEQREYELDQSLSLIGVSQANRYLLRIPELALLGSIRIAIEKAVEIGKQFQPDCVVGQDYEGGHEGHDAASFIASRLTQILGVKRHNVFPIYHGKPQERKGARFKPERKKYLTITLTNQEKKLKKDVLTAHAGQADHFEGLQKSSSDYMDLLTTREVFAELTSPIDYQERPTKLVGYEFHRNRFKFKDFLTAIQPALKF